MVSDNKYQFLETAPVTEIMLHVHTAIYSEVKTRLNEISYNNPPLFTVYVELFRLANDALRFASSANAILRGSFNLFILGWKTKYDQSKSYNN